MPFESVPWMVGGGASHSAEVGRLAAFVAANGNEGIIGLGDLKVSQLGTPGAGVLVSTGAAAITNRATNQPSQTYLARRPDGSDTVAVALTGAAIRSDMIVAQIEDPWLAGEPWADPVDPTVGPYIFARVISGVPAGSKTLADAGFSSRTAIPLARIDQPINNTSIINSQIIDLRKVANPRRELRTFPVNPAAAVHLTSTGYTDWITFSTTVDIPVWAVRAQCSMQVFGARIDRSTTTVNGTAAGALRLALGTAIGDAANYDIFAAFADGTARVAVGSGGTIPITSAMRGTVQTLKAQGTRSSGNKDLYVDTGTFAVATIEFQETAA